MIQKILVPVDGSEKSNKAIEFAADLAKTYKASVHFLFAVKPLVFPDDFGGTIVADTIDKLRVIGGQIISAAKAEAKKRGITKIETTVIEGDPTERIINYAKDHDVDIIVIGSRGRGTFKDVLLGSVANKVCHRSDRTCVIVK